jgi:hypothetical protein
VRAVHTARSATQDTSALPARPANRLARRRCPRAGQPPRSRPTRPPRSYPRPQRLVGYEYFDGYVRDDAGNAYGLAIQTQLRYPRTAKKISAERLIAHGEKVRVFKEQLAAAQFNGIVVLFNGRIVLITTGAKLKAALDALYSVRGAVFSCSPQLVSATAARMAC